MTTKQMKEMACAKAVSIEKFNTNNDWGFGGGIGTSYTFADGCELRIGTAYYRHLPSCRFSKLYYHNETDDTTENKKEIAEYLNKL